MDNNLKSLKWQLALVFGNRLEGKYGCRVSQSLAPFLFQPGLKISEPSKPSFLTPAGVSIHAGA
ncbi:MAG: hypothetical protein IPI17_17425 [Nitrosomonas sp.]|nr:hypothetical protein [Nitrosomonas sp.]